MGVFRVPDGGPPVAADPASSRSQSARHAALVRWSKVIDRQAAMRPAHEGLRARYDPGPGVPEPQRTKMIEAGLAAHMLRMRMAKGKAVTGT
jgi:hypothetical protein